MPAEALLIIDMLNDFLLPGAPLEVPAGRDIVPAVAAEADRARKEGRPVIFLCDRHAPEDPEFDAWPPHAVEGTEGARVVDELAPRPEDIVLPKTRYSAFFRTDLDPTLAGLGVKRLTLTGVLTNICILFTANDAYMRGYGITVPENGVAALTKEEHRFALGQMEKLMEADVVRS